MWWARHPVSGHPLACGLPAITARCLVVAGAHDMFPVEKAHELGDGLADSNLRVFDRSGHFAPLEEPEAFEAAVFAFLGV